jgi:hypothetical protein
VLPCVSLTFLKKSRDRDILNVERAVVRDSERITQNIIGGQVEEPRMKHLAQTLLLTTSLASPIIKPPIIKPYRSYY